MDALWPGDYREAGVRAHGSPGYSSREVGQERNTQTESWVWRWETKSESFLLGISVFHQHPQGVRAQWPFGAFQTFTWAALLSGMPALHRSEVYPSAASELKGWGPGPWTAGRDEPLGNRPAFHSSLQWLTVLGALRLLLLLDVRRCPESSQGTGGTSRYTVRAWGQGLDRAVCRAHDRAKNTCALEKQVWETWLVMKCPVEWGILWLSADAPPAHHP